MKKLGCALIYLLGVWVLYAQHVALTHAFAHLRPLPEAAQQVEIAPEPEKQHQAPGTAFCAYDATLCQLLLAAPGEGLAHPTLATPSVPALAVAFTTIVFARLHPPSRGPPAIL